MNPSGSQNAPSAPLVIAHYLIGATAFTIMIVLLLFAIDAMGGHYFQPRLLAVTHVGVLGWISTVIFGALYQLLPVILNTALHSERLAGVTLGSLSIGTAVLTYGFWNFDVARSIPIGGSMVLLAFFLFAYNAFRTLRNGKKRLQADLIATALIWLLVTGILGLMVGLNFHFPYLKAPHLEFLHLHAHFGIFGWFLLLIMGVASELIPMFLIAKGVSEKPLKIAYYGVNGGLFMMVLSFFLDWPLYLQHATALLFLSGVIAFGIFLRNVYRARLRKRLDIGMRISTAAFSLALLPIVFGASALFMNDLKWAVAYGTSILIGTISFLVIGQSYKTLPFIVWLWKYKQDVGKKEVPRPEDLYGHRFAEIQFWIFLLGILLLLTGLSTSMPPLGYVGASLLLMAGLLYQGNMLRIVFGKNANDG